MNHSSPQPQTNDENDDKLLTVRTVARRLLLDDTTVRRYIKDGRIEAIPLPHKNNRTSYRVRTSTLNKLLQRTVLEDGE